MFLRQARLSDYLGRSLDLNEAEAGSEMIGFCNVGTCFSRQDTGEMDR